MTIYSLNYTKYLRIFLGPALKIYYLNWNTGMLVSNRLHFFLQYKILNFLFVRFKVRRYKK